LARVRFQYGSLPVIRQRGRIGCSRSLAFDCILAPTMMGRLLRIAVLTPVLVVCAARAADDVGSLVGKQVMPKEGCKLNVGDKTTDDKQNSLPYVVQKVEGPDFVVGDRVKGTVAIADVVPLGAAASYYDDLIRHKPEFAWAFAMRGIVRRTRTDLNGAIADFSHAILLNPKDAFAYNNRGNAKAGKGDFD